jgi:hypothetical protein
MREQAYSRIGLNLREILYTLTNDLAVLASIVEAWNSSTEAFAFGR